MAWELFLSRPQGGCFGGACVELGRAHVAVIGAPFDGTSSFRGGSRFAPTAIRVAAANIEWFSLRSGFDVERLRFADLGDVAVDVDAREFIGRVRSVVAGLAGGRLLVVLGGEHTVSLGTALGLSDAGSPPCVLVADAHLDLRDEFMGGKLTHATWARRLGERIGFDRIAWVGFRAACGEEVEFARSRGLAVVSARDVRMLGVREAARRILSWLKSCECKALHITVDVDVFDPAYAPGVGNPEPEGLEPWALLDLLAAVVRDSPQPLLALDVVEVSPPHDPSGVTSVLAAKVVVEVAAAAAARAAAGKPQPLGPGLSRP